jgi:hypothetical protein
MSREFFIKFVISSLFWLANGTVTTLQCPSSQRCGDSSLVLKCTTTSGILGWQVPQRNIQLVYNYFYSPGMGSVKNYGDIQTILNQRNPTKSTMEVIPNQSIHGLQIHCIDGLDGHKRTCILQIISNPSPPINVTVGSILQHSAVLQWFIPSDTGGLHASIDEYYIHICSMTKQCFNITSVDVNSTITGLQANAMYNVTVFAVNCIGESSFGASVNFTTGVLLYVSKISFDAINYTTVNLKWKSNTSETVYYISLTETSNKTNMLLFTSPTSNLIATNLKKGIKYSCLIQVEDSFGRLSIMSSPLHFILDVPLPVNITSVQVDSMSYDSVRIIVAFEYNESYRPPHMGYIINHNGTDGFLSTQVNNTFNEVTHSFDISMESCAFEMIISIAAVNNLGIGEWAVSPFKPNINFNLGDNFGYKTINNKISEVGVTTVDITMTTDFIDFSDDVSFSTIIANVLTDTIISPSIQPPKNYEGGDKQLSPLLYHIITILFPTLILVISVGILTIGLLLTYIIRRKFKTDSTTQTHFENNCSYAALDIRRNLPTVPIYDEIFTVNYEIRVTHNQSYDFLST